MFLFFAALGVLKEQPIWCGVMFAAACNVKIIPLMVAPIFILYWMGRGWRSSIRFLASSGTLMLAGASWGLINCPAAFLRNVFGYVSFWGGWGVTYWLRQTGIKDFQVMDFEEQSPLQNHVALVLKVILLAGLLTLAWRRRKLGGLDFFVTLGAAFAWIFVVMPGAGPQYMVWFAPFILLLSPRWWLAITACATVYMTRFYHSAAHYHFPWDMAFPQMAQVPYWAPWTNLAWGAFIALVCCRAGSWLLLEKPALAVSPASTPAARKAP
jgi:uncharacterized membrane protein